LRGAFENVFTFFEIVAERVFLKDALLVIDLLSSTDLDARLAAADAAISPRT